MCGWIFVSKFAGDSSSERSLHRNSPFGLWRWMFTTLHKNRAKLWQYGKKTAGLQGFHTILLKNRAKLWQYGKSRTAGKYCTIARDSGECVAPSPDMRAPDWLHRPEASYTETARFLYDGHVLGVMQTCFSDRRYMKRAKSCTTLSSTWPFRSLV